MAQLLVNQRTGRVVTVQPDMHRWGRRESKQEWLRSGGLEPEWREPFVVIKVPGRPYTALLDLSGRSCDFAALSPDEMATLNSAGELSIQPWALEMLVR